MAFLSASHLSEISDFPDLLALVDNTYVRSTLLFTRLCAIHNCFESFMHILPHSSFAQNPLVLLAALDRWNIVEQMDCTRYSENAWKSAIRTAGENGHMQFIDNALTVFEDRNAYAYPAILGASIYDEIAVMQRFLPSISDQKFIGNIAVAAARHGSINCAQYCVKQVSPKQWLDMLLSSSDIHITDMILDHTPENCTPTHEWCVKFSKCLADTDVLYLDKTERAWRFVLQHMPWADVQNIVVRWSSKDKQRLHSIQQNIVLIQQTNTIVREETPLSKRKM